MKFSAVVYKRHNSENDETKQLAK